MTSQPRSNVTFTALIWLGMILAVTGAIVALLGAGQAIDFSAKFGHYELKTTSLGLAILMIGAALAAFVATRLPAGVVVFAVHKPTLSERLAASAPRLALIALIAFALFVLSLIVRF